MNTILQLNTSINGDTGLSTRLADRFTGRLKAAHPAARVIRRDLAADPVPHLSASEFQAACIPAGDRTPAQAKAAAQADRLIAELEAADVLVLGVPMYNFGVPSTLKAWFDHVARAGTTFRYTAGGPEGLLKHKRAYLFLTRGGRYAGTAADLQTPYLRRFLGFLGIEDVECIYVEGLAMGAEAGLEALEKAGSCIEALAA